MQHSVHRSVFKVLPVLREPPSRGNYLLSVPNHIFVLVCHIRQELYSLLYIMLSVKTHTACTQFYLVSAHTARLQTEMLLLARDSSRALELGSLQFACPTFALRPLIWHWVFGVNNPAIVDQATEGQVQCGTAKLSLLPCKCVRFKITPYSVVLFPGFKRASSCCFTLFKLKRHLFYRVQLSHNTRVPRCRAPPLTVVRPVINWTTFKNPSGHTRKVANISLVQQHVRPSTGIICLSSPPPITTNLFKLRSMTDWQNHNIFSAAVGEGCLPAISPTVTLHRSHSHVTVVTLKACWLEALRKTGKPTSGCIQDKHSAHRWIYKEKCIFIYIYIYL